MKRTGAITFTATEQEARQGIGTVIRGLEAQGVGGETLGNVEIALAEAVNNIVEHAYARRTPGQIRLRYDLGNSELRLDLDDDGTPYPDGQLPTGAPADLDVAVPDLPEGGFGWFLIRTLTRDLSYVRKDNRNSLILTFDVE